MWVSYNALGDGRRRRPQPRPAADAGVRPDPAGPRGGPAEAVRGATQAGLRAQLPPSAGCPPTAPSYAPTGRSFSATTCTAASPCAGWSSISGRTSCSSVSPVSTSACTKLLHDDFIHSSGWIKTRNRHKRVERQRFRWMHGLPVRDGDDAVQGAWVEFAIERRGERTYTNTFFTSLQVTAARVWPTCQPARHAEPVRLCLACGARLRVRSVAARPDTGRHPAQLLRGAGLFHGVVLLRQLDRAVRDPVKTAPSAGRCPGGCECAVVTQRASAMRLAAGCAASGPRARHCRCSAARPPSPRSHPLLSPRNCLSTARTNARRFHPTRASPPILRIAARGTKRRDEEVDNVNKGY